MIKKLIIRRDILFIYGIIGEVKGINEQEKTSVKFKVPAGRMMYLMIIVFLGGTIFWIVLTDVVFLDVVLSDPHLFMAFGVAMPIIWFLIFLLAVKIYFFNYHEITEKKLVISVPPRRISVPLEEIVEIKSDLGSIQAGFGRSGWDVKYEAYEPGKVHFDLHDLTLRYEEGYHKKGRSVGGKIEYGTSFESYGGITRVRSIFSDQNLVLIRTENKQIIINVPNAQEFVTEALKAMRSRKSNWER